MRIAGHAACLWQGDKLLIYGGENEHREHLSDVVIFDLKTATWTSPTIQGPLPRGRARHAAIIHDDKLFVVGGLTGVDSYTLNDVCFLDLKTWTWSRSWQFVCRFDHSIWVWGDRLWVFGGLGPDMERTSDLWWLELKSSPAFKGCPEPSIADQQSHNPRPNPARPGVGANNQIQQSTTTYAANSRSTQARPLANNRPLAPGAIGSIRFHSGADVPSFGAGQHFYCYSSGAILDLTTPYGLAKAADCSLSAFELNTFRWQRLADGHELLDNNFRWEYCEMNDDGTKAWLLGCPNETHASTNGNLEEYLSDVMVLDLTKYGLIGGDVGPETRFGMDQLPASDACQTSSLSGPAVDLANMFDRSPESGSSSDFQITACKDDFTEDEGESVISLPSTQGSSSPHPQTGLHSPPIHVHKLILLARWPHFTRAYAAQMVEFHSKKMHIPEPYSVVRAFLYYLYTDSINTHAEFCPSLYEVAGMLVMANVYDMPRLRLLCVHRLSREMDVESAATIWERAGMANDAWLKRRAAVFCMTHWGRVVRTQAFKRLSQQSMVDLCEVIDIEGRVVGGDELEVVGGLGGGKFGYGGTGSVRTVNHRRRSTNVTMSDEIEGTEVEAEDDEAMEVN